MVTVVSERRLMGRFWGVGEGEGVRMQVRGLRVGPCSLGGSEAPCRGSKKTQTKKNEKKEKELARFSGFSSLEAHF